MYMEEPIKQTHHSVDREICLLPVTTNHTASPHTFLFALWCWNTRHMRHIWSLFLFSRPRPALKQQDHSYADSYPKPASNNDDWARAISFDGGQFPRKAAKLDNDPRSTHGSLLPDPWKGKYSREIEIKKDSARRVRHSVVP